ETAYNIQRAIASVDDDSTSTETSATDNTVKLSSVIQREPADTSVPSSWTNLAELVSNLDASNATSDRNTANNSAAPTVQRAVLQDASPPQDSFGTATSTVNESTHELPIATVKPISSQPMRTSLPTASVRRSPGSLQGDTVNVIQRAPLDGAQIPVADLNPIDEAQYSQHLELLAQEVYTLLRQRLSLEKERQGPKYPR
ncbi:MAG: hypothetical protein AAF810_24555, partial [Cyanobacteria bacterium P01_D01_bin.36]